MKTIYAYFLFAIGVLFNFNAVAQETLETRKLVNISCRAYVGESAFIAGFAIKTERRILIRAIGPELGRFNVADVCKNPILRLYNGQTIIAENDDWDNSIETSRVFAEAGAFPLNTQTKDAVIIITLQPGIYTAVMTCNAGEEGVALLEVYDLNWKIPGGLTNLSMRGVTGPGDHTLIPGVVIGGQGDGNFLFRAIGPGLEQFGIKNYIPDPKLVITSGPIYQKENDDWQPEFSNFYFGTKGAFSLPIGSKDSALLLLDRVTGGTQTTTTTVNARIEDMRAVSGIVLFEIFTF